MTRINEVGIDVPINSSLIQRNDLYSQEMCTMLEENSDLNAEILAFSLKKQVIQSGLINCELIRHVYDLQWKYNLLKEKFNLKTKLVKFQTNKISSLEKLVDHLHDSFNKVTNLIDKLENEHWSKEKLAEPLTKGKFIRPIRPTVMEKTGDRRSKRLHTTSTAAHKLRFDDFTPRFQGLKSSFGEPHEDPYKLRNLETNLQLQTLFNQQMKGGYELAKSESSAYKQLLESYQEENLEVYFKEKER